MNLNENLLNHILGGLYGQALLRSCTGSRHKTGKILILRLMPLA